jgi:hypothetical protein
MNIPTTENLNSHPRVLYALYSDGNLLITCQHEHAAKLAETGHKADYPEAHTVIRKFKEVKS